MEILQEAQTIHAAASQRLVEYAVGITELGGLCTDYYLETLSMLFERCLLNQYWLLWRSNEDGRIQIVQDLVAQQKHHHVITEYMRQVQQMPGTSIWHILSPAHSERCHRIACYYRADRMCHCGAPVLFNEKNY